MRRREFVRKACSAVAATSGLLPLIRPGVARAAKPGKRVRVGQIGTTHWHAAGKMAALRRLTDEYEIVGIVEPDPDRRKAAEHQPVYRDLKWMTEEQLLNTPGLQAVAVETEVSDLVPIAVRCVAAGMHVHLDKPPSVSLSDFASLLRDSAQRGLTVQMGYMYRNNPAFLFCFRAIREGWLGEVFEAHGALSKTGDSTLRKQLAEFSGGVMFVLGCHLIDAVIIALGQPDKVTPYIRRSGKEPESLADNQLAVLEYPKAVATVRSTLIEVQAYRRRQLAICGTEGTIDFRPLETPRLLMTLNKPRGGFKAGYQEVKLPRMRYEYDDQLAELARIIRGEMESPYPPSHDLAVQKAVLLASGMPVK